MQKFFLIPRGVVSRRKPMQSPASVPQQAEPLPCQRRDRKTQAAYQRNGRTLETSQTTINGRSEEDEAQQEKTDDQHGAAWSFLIFHASVDQANQTLPLQNAGRRYQRSGHQHGAVAPSRANRQHQRNNQPKNQGDAHGSFKQCLKGLIGEQGDRMGLFVHGSIQEFPGPAPDLGPGLGSLLTAITKRTTYTSPEMPPNNIPA